MGDERSSNTDGATDASTSPISGTLGETTAWGDQGDGTYRNPVLNADYPDSDTEYHDGTYYMITSTQHMVPGMTILESSDLVSWSFVGHVFDRLTWDDRYDPDQMDGYPHGVWAGDLARHEGQWYCYFIDFLNGVYVSTAEKITGPWSDPQQILDVHQWTDPAVCWDYENEEAYMVISDWEDWEKDDLRLRVYEMSWDGRELLDDGEVVYDGNGMEAAKLRRFDGEWYIPVIEWRDDDRKQLILRSETDSVYGPYEERTVLESGNGIDRSCCQGSLVEGPAGDWWFLHQLVQNGDPNYQGRPQMLEPVRWEDGWPVVGEDVDDDGVGEPVHGGPKPIDGGPIDAPATDDDFTGDELGHQWQWNHNPRDGRWSLTERPDALRLKASVPVDDGGVDPAAGDFATVDDGDFWNAANTLSQRLMGTGEGVATAAFDVSGLEPGTRAGLCRHSDRYQLLSVVHEDGERRLVMNDDGDRTEGPTVSSDTVRLRTRNVGSTAWFEYDIDDDGEDFERLGPEFELTFGNWNGDRIGFHCWNDDQPRGYIDVEWFEYDYTGPLGGIEPDR